MDFRGSDSGLLLLTTYILETEPPLSPGPGLFLRFTIFEIQYLTDECINRGNYWVLVLGFSQSFSSFSGKHLYSHGVCAWYLGAEERTLDKSQSRLKNEQPQPTKQRLQPLGHLSRPQPACLNKMPKTN